jgi:hypothetical protein
MSTYTELDEAMKFAVTAGAFSDKYMPLRFFGVPPF